MPRSDIIHNAIKNALVKDGWRVTDDPYIIEYEERKLFADLAAERPFAAEKGNEKIVVEVKSFVGASLMREFETAVGQYNIYLSFLEIVAPERKLFLAVNHKIYEDFFTEKAVQMIVNRFKINLLVVDIQKEKIVLWTS